MLHSSVLDYSKIYKKNYKQFGTKKTLVICFAIQLILKFY